MVKVDTIAVPDFSFFSSVDSDCEGNMIAIKVYQVGRWYIHLPPQKANNVC